MLKLSESLLVSKILEARRDLSGLEAEAPANHKVSPPKLSTSPCLDAPARWLVVKFRIYRETGSRVP